jgi:hypothetical protein
MPKADATEIAAHVLSIGTSLTGHIPTDALVHFVNMAGAGRDVYAYHNPWARNLWLEDTRYEAADIRALWPIATVEGGRPYLIPPRGFIAWLQDYCGTDDRPMAAWLALWLAIHGKGPWEFIGQVARSMMAPDTMIHLAPFEQTLTNSDANLTAHEAAKYAAAIHDHLTQHGFYDKGEPTNGAE